MANQACTGNYQSILSGLPCFIRNRFIRNFALKNKGTSGTKKKLTLRKMESTFFAFLGALVTSFAIFKIL